MGSIRDIVNSIPFDEFISELETPLHILPTEDAGSHIDSYLCWCQPKMIYREPISGNELFLHNIAKDKLN